MVTAMATGTITGSLEKFLRATLSMVETRTTKPGEIAAGC
jgi:hypothetical protein